MIMTQDHVKNFEKARDQLLVPIFSPARQQVAETPTSPNLLPLRSGAAN
jgi:hypothetical protein